MDEIKGIRIVSLTGEKEYGIEDSEARQDVQQIVEGAPEAFDTFKEIAEYIAEDGAAAAEIIKNVAANAKGIADEITRAKAAEEGLEVKIADEAARATAAVAAEKARAEKHLADEVEKLKDGATIVGQAREIHSRNGKTVEASFLARTTAGSGTIGDGVATLKSVGGNIVKNLVDGTFESGWSAPFANTSYSVKNKVTTFTSKENNGRGRFRYAVPSGKSGHIYYQKTFIKCSVVPNDKEVRLGVMNSSGIEAPNCLTYAKSTTEWQFLSVRYNTPASGNYGEVNVYDTRKENQGEINIYKYLYIDLTEMFGAGNEPTLAECDKLFGTMDALPKGLTIANPKEFKSTGYNQADPNKILVNKGIENGAIVDKVGSNLAVVPCLPCKVGIGENNGYCIHGNFNDSTEKVYLTPLNPLEGDGELYLCELTKDVDKGTYVPQIKGYMLVEVPNATDLCVHLLWSEDRGRHDFEPYYESKVELPVIPEMPEYGLAGVQSSGTLACDEIDFEKGVYRKRIYCIEDLGTLNWGRTAGAARYVKVGEYNILPDLLSNLMVMGYVMASPADVYNGRIDKSIFVGKNCYFVANKCVIAIYDSQVTDANSMATALSGISLYAELEEPIEYPLPKVANNYTSSDYGVEQFDGSIPCNANNLYYMRSLAGETRNFLDRMYANTKKKNANEVADYITSDIGSIRIVQQTEATVEIAPNVLNLWGEVTNLDITLTEADATKVNEYMFQFTSGEIATTLVLPSEIKWVSAPNIQASKTYQVSIINNLGVIGEFSYE